MKPRTRYVPRDKEVAMSQDRLNHEMHELVCMTKDNYVPRQKDISVTEMIRRETRLPEKPRFRFVRKKRANTEVERPCDKCSNALRDFHRLLPTPHTHTYTHQPTHIHLYPPTFTFTHIQCL